MKTEQHAAPSGPAFTSVKEIEANIKTRMEKAVASIDQTGPILFNVGEFDLDTRTNSGKLVTPRRIRVRIFCRSGTISLEVDHPEP